MKRNFIIVLFLIILAGCTIVKQDKSTNININTKDNLIKFVYDFFETKSCESIFLKMEDNPRKVYMEKLGYSVDLNLDNCDSRLKKVVENRAMLSNCKIFDKNLLIMERLDLLVLDKFFETSLKSYEVVRCDIKNIEQDSNLDMFVFLSSTPIKIANLASVKINK